MKKLLTLVALCALATSVAAQNSRTTSKMLYHDGPVLKGTRNIYVIWYGCWADNCGREGDTRTMRLMLDFLITAGHTPYMQINSTYPDASGQAPTGGFGYSGVVNDTSYSHGVELTKAQIEDIIWKNMLNFQLPHGDPQGIYVVIASADIAANETGFCKPGAPPYHGVAILGGILHQYVFLGNPNRCPSVAGPQFSPTGPTPNDTFAGDALVANMAHALNTTLTNPFGNAWYDRYGLENADKCSNTFGQTYPTPNGARANVRFGGRDYLIEQNWVNDRKARCAMSR